MTLGLALRHLQLHLLPPLPLRHLNRHLLILSLIQLALLHVPNIHPEPGVGRSNHAGHVRVQVVEEAGVGAEEVLEVGVGVQGRSFTDYLGFIGVTVPEPYLVNPRALDFVSLTTLFVITSTCHVTSDIP